MSFHNDKVSDVLVILTLIRHKFITGNNYRSFNELRKEAIREFAESELRKKRYRNEPSAVKTLHDACARRLKPDIVGIRNFDTLVGQWLCQNVMILKHILLNHSINAYQRNEIIQLF